MIILSIGSAAVIYSAWYMNIPIFSFGWFLYCLSWIPLLMIFVSAEKYDKSVEKEEDQSEIVAHR